MGAMRPFLLRLALLLLVCGAAVGCVSERATELLTITEGPPLQVGRMSASLAVLSFLDGKFAVLGGSPTEFPFKPLKGADAIEIYDPALKAWQKSEMNVPYPLAGRAFLLKDLRIFMFASVLEFPEQEPEVGQTSADVDGLVTAALLDLGSKQVKDFLRPLRNALEASPRDPVAPEFLQRAFDHTLQLQDGRIVRIGGEAIRVLPMRVKSCTEKKCVYCRGTDCKPEALGAFCTTEDDCPAPAKETERTFFSLIEVYTPPDNDRIYGQVARYTLPDARKDPRAVQLQNGKIFIAGGRGPSGAKPVGTYDTTYLFDADSGKITDGPRLRVGRKDLSMALLEDGRVLLTGGTNKDGITTNLAEIYDPKLGVLFNTDPMTERREDHIAARLGPWLVFFGGEVNDQADLIRNSAEAYDAKTGRHIGRFFLFSRDNVADQELCPGTKGYAGIDDFAVFNLDPNEVMILGGQQGCQNPEGDYISAGKGSVRTLFVRFPKR